MIMGNYPECLVYIFGLLIFLKKWYMKDSKKELYKIKKNNILAL